MSFTFRPVASKFTPRYGAKYYFIGVGPKNQLNLLIGKRQWTNDRHDKARMASNNVYPTLEAAKAARSGVVGQLKIAQIG